MRRTVRAQDIKPGDEITGLNLKVAFVEPVGEDLWRVEFEPLFHGHDAEIILTPEHHVEVAREVPDDEVIDYDQPDIYTLLVGRYAVVRDGAKPAGWEEHWADDILTGERGQITATDPATNTVEIGGWWYYARDIEME